MVILEPASSWCLHVLWTEGDVILAAILRYKINRTVHEDGESKF